jgi:N-acetylmuramoyl-L-alanine amidase
VLKLLRLVLPLLVLAPGAANAADVSVVARDIPLHGSRMLAAAQPQFDMVGLHWRGAGSVSFRTRSLARGWTRWRPAAPEAEDEPDVLSAENRLHGWRIGNPWWTGASDRIEVRTHGRVSRVRAFFLDSPVEKIPLRRLSIAGSPPIITRAQWGADEEIRRAAPLYADALRFAVVHHTAGASGSSPAQAAAIVRGIEVYHVKSNGWNDIGYNFLVDRWGNVYEGRFGGVARPVIGAHALGFNTGSVGIALIGTYSSAAPPPAQLQGLEKLAAWRLDLVHIDPLSTVIATSGGNEKFSAGTQVALRAVSGHRDTGSTSCPGSALYALLGSVRSQIAVTGGPKLYAPAAKGTLGGLVRFTGKLSAALPWTVTVRDGAGKTVAVGSGTGTVVDWTWDARGVNPRAPYAWVMAAGPDVRPASGGFGGRARAPAPALAVTAASATPQRIDGTTNTSTTVAYTLSVAASVTAELLNSVGTPIATLFVEQKPAGVQSFEFDAQGLLDGTYRIRLTARDSAGRTASAAVVVVVSRTVLAFSADTRVISPNGDGRRDAATFTLVLAQQATLSLSLVSGQTSIPLFAGSLQPGSETIPFDGIAPDGGTVPDGPYRATLTMGVPPLAYIESLRLTVDTVAPRLGLVSVTPLRLRVNEKASIRGTVNGRAIATSAKPGVFRLGFRGRLRTLRLVARDAAGNDSPPLSRRLR